MHSCCSRLIVIGLLQLERQGLDEMLRLMRTADKFRIVDAISTCLDIVVKNQLLNASLNMAELDNFIETVRLLHHSQDAHDRALSRAVDLLVDCCNPFEFKWSLSEFREQFLNLGFDSVLLVLRSTRLEIWYENIVFVAMKSWVQSNHQSLQPQDVFNLMQCVRYHRCSVDFLTDIVQTERELIDIIGELELVRLSRINQVTSRPTISEPCLCSTPSKPLNWSSSTELKSSVPSESVIVSLWL